MVNFQLCSRDEYGQASILQTSSNLDEMTERMVREVNSLNVDNALTVDDKKRNWTAYAVKLFTKKTTYVYAEKNNRRKDIAYEINRTVKTTEKVSIPDPKKPVEGEIRIAHTEVPPVTKFSVTEINVSEIKNCDVKILLGTLDGKEWFAEDARGKVINSLSHPDLENKTVFFIRKV